MRRDVDRRCSEITQTRARVEVQDNMQHDAGSQSGEVPKDDRPEACPRRQIGGQTYTTSSRLQCSNSRWIVGRKPPMVILPGKNVFNPRTDVTLHR